jgi:excisionase family DNA binding protein
MCISLNGNFTTERQTNTRSEASMHAATSQGVTPQWLRFPEAERYSGLGRTTLTRLIGIGEIKAVKVGKSVRISRTSLDKYMERQVIGDGES